MKRKSLYVFFAMLYIFVSINAGLKVEAANNDIGSLYSLSAALMDGDSGRVLYEKEGYEIRPMASTTKIMTLIIALEYGQLDDVVSVSSYASKMPEVRLGIKEGEQYYLNDLFYSLMLESHNDVATAIAEHIGGSVNGFANLMNDKAKEIGLNDTYFITPNGLDASDNVGTHSTTAIDLAKLMKYCVMDSPQKEQFKSICQTKNYSFSNYDKTREFFVSNKNAFLDMMEGVLAGKTGFTADAGYCYVVAICKDERTYIVALLGAGWPNNKNYKWKDSKKLLNYGIANYYKKDIINAETPMKYVYVANGTPDDKVFTYIDENVQLLIGEHEEIKLEYNIPNKIKPPVYKGDIVGCINYYINGKLQGSVNIYAISNIFEKDFSYYLDSILKVLF